MINSISIYQDGAVIAHTSKIKKSYDKFPPGYFEAFYDNNGKLIIKSITIVENHDFIYTKENKLILDTIDNFFNDGIKIKVETMGFIHKLGILLYGDAGTGKTGLMNSISNKMIKDKKAIVLFANSYDTFSGAINLCKEIRLIQDEPIIIIADEFDRYVYDYESDLKNFLDGKDSISNLLFLASTNYIERIPDTLKSRPSRFKISCEIKGIDDRECMIEILGKISNKLNPSLFTEDELNVVFDKYDVITIDQIKQLALDKLTNSFIPEKITNKIGFDYKSSKYKEEVPIPKQEEKSFSFESKPTIKLDRKLKKPIKTRQYGN